MLATGKQKKTPPEIKRKSVKAWLKGYMSQLDDGRMPEDGLATAANVVLSQNGTVRPAPSSVLYGTQPPGTVLGQIFSFTREVAGVTTKYQCALINVAGTVNLYYWKDGGAYTIATGATYSTTASGRFAQVKNVVMIADGVDSVTYLDTSTMTITSFTVPATPSAPTPTVVAALVGANYSYRYRIAAVNVFESAASTAAVATTLLQRDIWNPTTNYIDLSWSAVAGATHYNIYMGVSAGSEQYIGTVTGTAFRDDGTIASDATRVAPASAATAGPKVSYVRVLSDRIFMWGDVDDKWKIWYGGTGADTLKFSAFFGGGYTRVADGTEYIPNNVSMYRTGKGDPAITVFCKGAAGTGKRFVMTENTLTEGDTVITYFGVQEDNGAYGTDSPDGVVMAEDDIFYPSKDSFKKTGTRINLQNILSTRGISDVIQDDVLALNAKYMYKACGLYYQGRIKWAVPYGGATSNNQIWTLDITRGGAWMLPLDISADWMWLYEDNDGITHECYLSGNQIFEFTYSYSTQRNGTAFSTSIGSGLIKFSDDGMEWAKVLRLVLVLIRPQGFITANVTAKTEDAAVAPVGTEQFAPDTSITGLGEEALGMYYIGELRNVPTSYGNQREELTVEVDEEVNWLQWTLNSSGTGVDYELSDAIIYYIPTGTKDQTE
jgi:hypothetical protein